MLNPNEPLWLPAGSIRSLLALSIVGAYLGGLFDNLEVVTLVLGFYFADRASSSI